VKQYRIGGIRIASDLSLPELVPARSRTIPDWTVRTASPRPIRLPWFRHVRFPGGRRWMSIARGENRYVVKFWRLATFDIDISDRLIRSMPGRRTPPETVRHLLLDQVLPLVAASRNRVTLHASAVGTKRGAIAFLGATGKGKSTIAALFAKAGWPVIADDCLLVERRRGQLVTLPNYPGLRLWPDAVNALFTRTTRSTTVAHYSRKRRVGGTALPFARAPMPLARVYVLGGRVPGRRPGVVIERRGATSGMLDLLRFVHCLDTADRERISTAFDLLGAIAAATPIRTLTFRRTLSRLREVHDAVVADLRE
jgi:hypothetical protein